MHRHRNSELVHRSDAIGVAVGGKSHQGLALKHAKFQATEIAVDWFRIHSAKSGSRLARIVSILSAAPLRKFSTQYPPAPCIGSTITTDADLRNRSRSIYEAICAL